MNGCKQEGAQSARLPYELNLLEFFAPEEEMDSTRKEEQQLIINLEMLTVGTRRC